MIRVHIFNRGFVTATSAAVESEFADLKNREFRGEIPMCIDRFVNRDTASRAHRQQIERVMRVIR